jgi:hypothetical protein
VAESRNGLTGWPYGYGIGTASLGTQYVARLLNARELQEFIYALKYICINSYYDYYSAAMLTSIDGGTGWPNLIRWHLSSCFRVRSPGQDSFHIATVIWMDGGKKRRGQRWHRSLL